MEHALKTRVYVTSHTLSVSIVATSSSACTESPGCLSHVFRVPSEMDSAIWGTFTVSAAIDTVLQHIQNLEDYIIMMHLEGDV